MSSQCKAYLGFSNLPNQVHRKSVKKGFEFNLMSVGPSGLGKGTLVNCLFYQSQLYKDRKIPSVENTVNSKVVITSNTVDIEEGGVKLKLTVADTTGFGDAINNEDHFEPIVDYIDEQYEKFLQHESGLNRRHIEDKRIHCLFYFISPIGYSLKPLDITLMKLLCKRVNIIPIIGKADGLTKSELRTLKKNIMSDIESNDISIYKIPDCDYEEDEEYKDQIKQIRSAVPYAVSSSIDGIEIKGKKVIGREYPWGFVETENADHSDFVKLRSLLVTNMQDLREVTHELHYENYRASRLAEDVILPGSPRIGSRNSAADNGSDSHTDQILKEKEAELTKMKEQIAHMQEQMLQSMKRTSNTEHPENGAQV